MAESGTLKPCGSEVGKAEKGPSGLFPRFGGRPRVFPVEDAPLLQAEETTLAPCRLAAERPLEGVMADFGSDGSVQKAFRVEGVIAEWGYAVRGVWTISEFVHGAPGGWAMAGVNPEGGKK